MMVSPSSAQSPPPRRPGDLAAALAEGALFGGRYRVLRHLATGGMGSIYEVLHVETDRRRALKIMHPHLFQSGEMRDRFKREARICAQIDSEYIVDVSDAGVDEATGTPFLVMELLHGEELGDRVRRLGRLPPAEVVTFLNQVALALDKTQAKGIIHRDLKPENVFLTLREDGAPRVKILDFGVAKVVAEGATAAGATRSLGTPLYMAPEQFQISRKLTPSADVYALGMMAYTLLVGEPYWAREANAAGDVLAFAMVAVLGPKEPATDRAASRGAALPAAFDGWFSRVTAVDPAARFPSATEAVRALAEVLGVSGSGVTQVLPILPGIPTGLAATVPATPVLPTTPMTRGTPVPATAVSGDLPRAVADVAETSGNTAAMEPTPERGSPPTLPMTPAERASTTGAAVVMPKAAPPRPRRASVYLIAGSAGVALGLLGYAVFRAAAGHAPAAPNSASPPEVPALVDPGKAASPPSVEPPVIAHPSAVPEPPPPNVSLPPPVPDAPESVPVSPPARTATVPAPSSALPRAASAPPTPAAPPRATAPRPSNPPPAATSPFQEWRDRLHPTPPPSSAPPATTGTPSQVPLISPD